MRYPKLAKPATRCEELVLNIDLAPTLLELAGLPIPGTMQGRSWVGVLQGRPGRDSFLYEYFAEKGDRFKRPVAVAVRTKRWKYVTYPLDSSLTSELYDLQTDPEELDNLIGDPKCSATLNELKDELENLKRQTGFRFPPAGGRQRRELGTQCRPGPELLPDGKFVTTTYGHPLGPQRNKTSHADNVYFAKNFS